MTAPVNGYVAKSDAVLAGRIDQLQRKLAFASQLAGLFRNVCAATAFCILDPVLGQIQAGVEKVTRWSRQGREDTHLRIVHLTQPAVPHTGHTG